MPHDDEDLKADFDSIYAQPDPRAYFATLRPLEYAIPGHGADAVADLLASTPFGTDRAPRLLDVCCSYGVLGMLLKTGLSTTELYDHYAGAERDGLGRAELVARDRDLIAEHAQPDAPHVLGLDVAAPAVDYAVQTGALDAGSTADLEAEEPSEELTARLAEVDLVTTTGGIGYVTEKTFERILDRVPSTAWFASFCLRTYDFEPVAETLGRHGRSTERAEGTFRQRRFADEEEQGWAVSAVEARGLDPAGKESEGYYHADFYLSRPESSDDERSLAQLLPGLTVYR